MSKPKYITPTTYEIDAHNKSGQFVVPKQVLEALGLTNDDPIHLIIRDPISREILFEGNKYKNSRREVSGPDTKAVSRSKQRIRVTASRPE